MTAAVRVIFGCEPEQVNALFALTYAQAAGGFMRLTLTDPGCAQEKKIKVAQRNIIFRLINTPNFRVDHSKYHIYLWNVLVKKKFNLKLQCKRFHKILMVRFGSKSHKLTCL